MNDQLIEAFENRLAKRLKHLNKWVKKNQISYFRVFDRDITDVPVIIDSLPHHWLVWVCDHGLSTEVETQLMELITERLESIQRKEVVIKSRHKKELIKQRYNQQDTIISIEEGGLIFELNLTRYLDTGLFIDHRLTRQWVRQQSKGKRILNLFAYTGSFSCYALAGGASFVTSVDLNPVYSDWHQKNSQLNQFKDSQYAIVTADVMTFLDHNKSKYDLIICDPPSFSQSKRKGVQQFQVQKDAKRLLAYCFKSLKPTGIILFSTNYRSFKMDEVISNELWNAKEMTGQFCSKDFEGKYQSRSWLLNT